jgi:hypothetical protein
MMDAEAMLMAHPFPSKSISSTIPSSFTRASSLIASPQVGFSWTAVSGTWSSFAALRGLR